MRWRECFGGSVEHGLENICPFRETGKKALGAI